MTKRRQDTDYLFLSARIRAMERRLLTAQRLEPLLTRYGLPTAIDCDEAALRRCVGHDKKTAGGTVQLVIVRCMGQGELVTVPLSDLWEDKA